MSLRKVVILESFTCYPKYIKVSKMFLVDQWFLTVASPTENVSEFLDHHLNPEMQGGKSYTKDSEHFLEKNKDFKMYTW